MSIISNLIFESFVRLMYDVCIQDLVPRPRDWNVLHPDQKHANSHTSWIPHYQPCEDPYEQPCQPNAKTRSCVQGRFWPCRLQYSPRKRPRSIDEPQYPSTSAKNMNSQQAVVSYHHHHASLALRLCASNDHPAQRAPPPHSQPAQPQHQNPLASASKNPPSFVSVLQGTPPCRLGSLVLRSADRA